MAANLVRQPVRQPEATAAFDRRTSRHLYAVQSDTVLRVARVQSGEHRQTEKVHEIDSAGTREAMSGRRW